MMEDKARGLAGKVSNALKVAVAHAARKGGGDDDDETRPHAALAHVSITPQPPRRALANTGSAVSLELLSGKRLDTVIVSTWHTANATSQPDSLGMRIVAHAVGMGRAGAIFAELGPQSTMEEISGHGGAMQRADRVHRFVVACVAAVRAGDEAALTAVCEQLGELHHKRGVNIGAGDAWTHYKQAILNTVVPAHGGRTLADNLADPAFRAWSTLFMLMSRHIKAGFLASVKQCASD